MPTYAYETPSGEIIERYYRMGEAPDKILLGKGRTAKRCYQAEVRPRKNTEGAWPMEPCVASGVHPDQAGDLRRYLADRGCKTEVTPQGDPVYRSPQHRKRALRLRGMHDRASFD